MSANNLGSSCVITTLITTPRRTLNTSASPAVRDASAPRISPNRLAATAVRPTPTISANEMIIQIQNSEVETAASPAAPILVPTQYASTDEKSVISSDDATAGIATRRI